MDGSKAVVVSIPFPRVSAVQQRPLPWYKRRSSLHYRCRSGLGILVETVHRIQYHL